jgi:hypothetical protein
VEKRHLLKQMFAKSRSCLWRHKHSRVRMPVRLWMWRYKAVTS